MTTTGARPFASQAEYDHYAAQYWAMKKRRDGGRAPMTTGQHIFCLLLTVFTAGLGAIVWIIWGIRGNRVLPDPTAPVPGWPPPGFTDSRRPA